MPLFKNTAWLSPYVMVLCRLMNCKLRQDLKFAKESLSFLQFCDFRGVLHNDNLAAYWRYFNYILPG